MVLPKGRSQQKSFLLLPSLVVVQLSLIYPIKTSSGGGHIFTLTTAIIMTKMRYKNAIILVNKREKHKTERIKTEAGRFTLFRCQRINNNKCELTRILPACIVSSCLCGLISVLWLYAKKKIKMGVKYNYFVEYLAWKMLFGKKVTKSQNSCCLEVTAVRSRQQRAATLYINMSNFRD